jgi:acyl carrier protein
MTMHTMEEVKSILKSHILTEYLPGESEKNLSSATPLRTSGILDSIATVKLVSFIEDTFRIEIDAHETGIQNVDRIDDIAAFVLRKLGKH